jgi:hypothetical protein
MVIEGPREPLGPLEPLLAQGPLHWRPRKQPKYDCVPAIYLFSGPPRAFCVSEPLGPVTLSPLSLPLPGPIIINCKTMQINELSHMYGFFVLSVKRKFIQPGFQPIFFRLQTIIYVPNDFCGGNHNPIMQNDTSLDS